MLQRFQMAGGRRDLRCIGRVVGAYLRPQPQGHPVPVKQIYVRLLHRVHAMLDAFQPPKMHESIYLVHRYRVAETATLRP